MSSVERKGWVRNAVSFLGHQVIPSGEITYDPSKISREMDEELKMNLAKAAKRYADGMRSQKTKVRDKAEADLNIVFAKESQTAQDLTPEEYRAKEVWKVSALLGESLFLLSFKKRYKDCQDIVRLKSGSIFHSGANNVDKILKDRGARIDRDWLGLFTTALSQGRFPSEGTSPPYRAVLDIKVAFQ